MTITRPPIIAFQSLYRHCLKNTAPFSSMNARHDQMNEPPEKYNMLFFAIFKTYYHIKYLPDKKLNSLLPFNLTPHPILTSPLLESQLDPSQQNGKEITFENDKTTSECADNTPIATKLSELLLILTTELPRFFDQPHPHAIYSPQLVFSFNYTPITFKTESHNRYRIFLSTLRSLLLLFYNDLKFEIIKITKSKSEQTIRIRWRISGTLKLFKMCKPLYIDAISTIHMTDNGLVDIHSLERVTELKDPSKVPSLALSFLASLGLFPKEQESPIYDYTSDQRARHNNNNNNSSSSRSSNYKKNK